MTVGDQISGLLVQLDATIPVIKAKLESGLSPAQAQQIKAALSIIGTNLLQLAA